MTGKCSNTDCVAPISCHEGEEHYAKCEHWLKSNSSKQEAAKERKAIKKSSLPWSGEAFSVNDLAQVAIRNNPAIIGVVGKADAGKTTYLAMLFTLLLRGGKLKHYNFAGTKTIQGWDELYHKLKVQRNKVAFPDPTPAQYNKLLHVALRDSKDRLKDVLFSDASGEVFSLWSQNREDVNAENARWIYTYSSAFILFIDCVDLINRKNSAKTEIIDIAQMLQHDLKERPIIAVWSKADKKEGVHQRIKETLQEELKALFKNYSEIDISNFSSDDPDILVHANNLSVLDWLLQKVFTPSNIEVTITNESDDFFLNYKGK